MSFASALFLSDIITVECQEQYLRKIFSNRVHLSGLFGYFVEYEQSLSVPVKSSARLEKSVNYTN